MRTRNIYLGIFISLFMVACDKPESTPELKDPIYLDLKTQESIFQKQIDDKLKEIEGLEQTMGELLDNDYQKKLTREEIFKTKNELAKLKQKKEFYRISKESRQIFARQQYLEYYKNKQKWPPEDIKEQYLQRKKLAEAPKAWQRGVASEKTPSE